MKKTTILFFTLLLLTSTVKSQQKSIYIKTNTFNWVFAGGPHIAFEYFPSNNKSITLQYAFGDLASITQQEKCTYKTLIVEGRWYTTSLLPHNINLKWKPYAGIYARQINRQIKQYASNGGPYGIFNSQSRDFKGNGLATGISFGDQLMWNRWAIDGNILLGYGKYYHQYDKLNPTFQSTGFLDCRIGLQVAYKL